MIPQSETERILEERLAALGVHGRAVGRADRLRRRGYVGRGDAAAGGRTRGDAAASTGWSAATARIRHRAARPRLRLRRRSTPEATGSWPTVHIDGLRAERRARTSSGIATGILAFFPIVGDRWRVIADLGPRRRPSARPDPTLAEIKATAERIAARAAFVMSDPIWLAAFRINERKVEDYRKGRVFLAGDAAHIHSPAGGQGMNTGMQDAFNLAWKLALVVAGRRASRRCSTAIPPSAARSATACCAMPAA